MKMKEKITALILALVLICGLCGCSNGNSGLPVPPADPPAAAEEADAAGQPELDGFPIVGTWQNEDDDIRFIRIKDDGTMTVEVVLISTYTHTSNGVSSSSTTKSVDVFNSSWEMKKNTFSYEGVFLNQGVMSYKALEENGTYRLVGDKDYSRNLHLLI